LRPAWAEGVALVVEHLLCELNALNSNPSPTKKKKKVLRDWGHRSVLSTKALSSITSSTKKKILDSCCAA
jgi:hypothetical protein